jgi:hypothetical protein
LYQGCDFPGSDYPLFPWLFLGLSDVFEGVIFHFSSVNRVPDGDLYDL